MTWELAPDDTVAVIGAGTMGAGIAHVVAAAGHPVLLHDADSGAVGAALAQLTARLERSVDKGRISKQDARSLVERIRPASSVGDLAPARLVVEAIVEDLAVKQQVLSETASVLADDAVIATNTSSLSVTAIAGGVPRSERVAGLHFFNPAPVMPLVEVVSGALTDPGVADGLVAAAERWGKRPVRCTSTPGFIVNRVARPFYGESLRLLQERVADVPTIDAVVTGAGGFRMGPFALMDLVGLDVNLAVSTSVYEQTAHDGRFAPNVLQQAQVEAGRLGRKTGGGWYDYGPDALEPAVAPLEPAALPRTVVEHGSLGWAHGIVGKLVAAGVDVDVVDGDGPGHLAFDGICLVPTDGRTATEHVAAETFDTHDVVVFDLVHDWATASRIAIAVADQAGPRVAATVAAVFAAIGLDVSLVDDSPGLILMRIVAQLASVAADAVHLGVAAPADIDTAMRLGTNYPAGPLEWADALGVERIVAVLDHLHGAYGEERYRVSLAVRRAAQTGARLRPDQLETNDLIPAS
jgi:3-hydroxybutyryl-CoA dehydrogenase